MIKGSAIVALVILWHDGKGEEIGDVPSPYAARLYPRHYGSVSLQKNDLYVFPRILLLKNFEARRVEPVFSVGNYTFTTKKSHQMMASMNHERQLQKDLFEFDQQVAEHRGSSCRAPNYEYDARVALPLGK